MKTFLQVLAAVAILSPAAMPSASAQQKDALSNASTEFFNSCVKKQGASVAECACVTGFFGGMMDEDEFQIMTALMPFIGEDGEVADMDGAIAAAQAKQIALGVSTARFVEIMDGFIKLDARGKYGDRICMPLGGK